MDHLDKLANQELIDGLLSDKGSSMQKEAAETADSYLRDALYEKGFMRKIQPMVSVGKEDLDQQIDTDKPVIICEKEVATEAAYSIPFGTLPIGAYIKGRKFRVMFDRIASRRYRIDVDQLLTYKMDIRKMFEDLLLKKIQEEEDRKYLLAANMIVTTKSDAGNTVLGKANFTDVNTPAYQNDNVIDDRIGITRNILLGTMDRDSLTEMSKGLPNTENSLNPSIALTNNITIRDVCKLSREEIGGDMAQELFVKGYSDQEIAGMKWIVTIKKDLVPTNVVYQFASPKFLGKAFSLRDVALSSKSEDMFIEFYAWESIGATIQNGAAICRSTFVPGSTDNYGWVTGTVGGL